jgi:flavin reductase (DIM6/NTAB) family NADH-FMN oxidoreductase RutF
MKGINMFIRLDGLLECAVHGVHPYNDPDIFIVDVNEISFVHGACSNDHTGVTVKTMYVHLKNGKVFEVRQNEEQISALLDCKVAPEINPEQIGG